MGRQVGRGQDAVERAMADEKMLSETAAGTDPVGAQDGGCARGGDQVRAIRRRGYVFFSFFAMTYTRTGRRPNLSASRLVSKPRSMRSPLMARPVSPASA